MGDVKQGAGRASLEFTGKVWVGILNVQIYNVEIACQVTRLDEMIKEMGVGKKEKRSKDETL